MNIDLEEAASTEYLSKNNAASVATNRNGISNFLNKIQLDLNILNGYAYKAWSCGKRNHRIDEIQNTLYQELSSLVKEVKNESIAD